MNFPVRTLALLTALTLSGTALPAFAEQVTLSATLSGAEEVPANGSAATGLLTATYDSVTNELDFSVEYSGLTGEATAAHFHGPAGPDETAPPSLPVDGPLASPIEGTAMLTDDQEAELLGGLWYFNVHTAQYPDGEIRGQLFQSAMSQESSAESSMESSAMSSEMPSSEMSSEMSSESSELSSVASSAVSSVSSELSSASSELSSAVSSASSELSSAVSSVSSEVSSAVSSASSELSSAVSDVSSAISSALDTSVSASAEVSTSVEISVAP